MSEEKRVKILANYIERDGTTTQILLELKVPPNINLARALAAYIRSEHQGKMVDYTILTPAW